MQTTQVHTAQTTWTVTRQAAPLEVWAPPALPLKPAPAPEPFIDKLEVAARLGVRPRTVDDWMKRGLIPYYKPGHYVRFRWSEIQVFLAQNSRVCRREIPLA
jgi:excisionase family DNA binding protein